MIKYGYIYCTTNIINGKRYVGQHKSSDWNYNYFGSGKNILRAIKKYGKQSFTCFPLAWACNKNELNQLEIDYIAHYKPEYNIAKGGNVWGSPHLNETRIKIANSVKGNKHNKGRKHLEEKKKNMGRKKGFVMSEEHKIKIRNSLKGIKKTSNHCKHISEGRTKYNNKAA